MFMCRSDLTMMFHAVADNFRELGNPLGTRMKPVIG